MPSDKDLGIFADSLEVSSDIRPEKTPEEEILENTKASEDRALRPQTLDDYIGQTFFLPNVVYASPCKKIVGFHGDFL